MRWWRWIGLGAIALWVISAFTGTTTTKNFAVPLPFIIPLGLIWQGKDGSRFEFKGEDWFWVVATLIVIYAMVNGVDPKTLLDWIKNLKS
jgi:hypothetical protein